MVDIIAVVLAILILRETSWEKQNADRARYGAVVVPELAVSGGRGNANKGILEASAVSSSARTTRKASEKNS